MSKIAIATFAIVASCLLAGCNGDAAEGSAPPPTKPLTETQLQSMPPEARAQAESAAKAGDYQSQRMKEMAEAQKKAQGGR